ncbi:MAG: hypothetical protein HC860_09220 [Alkalinema sp. RU_4_3]|nr:hypothetical protein [Alkalinema sp. RU_4_3]
MVTDHGYVQGFGEICSCERCLRLPWRRVTWWGLLGDLTPSLLERRLRREGLKAEVVELACLCLEAYRLVCLPEVLAVQYFCWPGPESEQLREMAIVVSERWGEAVSEGMVMVQLGMIVEVCYELAP